MGLGLGVGLSGCMAPNPIGAPLPNPRRNDRYPLDRPLTPMRSALANHAYLELSSRRDDVHAHAGKLRLSPWTLRVDGAVQHPQTFDLDALIRADRLEERPYRVRSDEGWSMTIPWVGMPLSRVLHAVQPLGSARFVRFVSLADPEQMPNLRALPGGDPYHEALTLAEAMHDLTLLAVGAYGRTLIPAAGAPIRLVVPWKYSFKNLKALVHIQVTEEEPPSFWATHAPQHRSWKANVMPRRSGVFAPTVTERLLPTGERVPTRPYNGYGPWVAGLYPP